MFTQLCGAANEVTDERACVNVLILRVREMEDKVRELGCSIARMGAQQDVNMELIDTFRHQKETVRVDSRRTPSSPKDTVAS